MKKIVMLVVVMMMMAFVAVAQAEVRAGGLPAVAGVSTDCSVTDAGPRAGGLPALTVDERIKNCPCPPYCPPVAESAPIAEPIRVAEPVPVVEPAPAPAPQPAIIEKGRQTLNVEFDFDKATIKKDYYNDIDNLVKVMKDYPDLNVVIEGHTDNVGSDAYNKKLSQRRAESVKKYMVEKGGIDANRLTAQGFGEEKPIASNDTDEGRQQNRRVEAAVDYLIEN